MTVEGFPDLRYQHKMKTTASCTDHCSDQSILSEVDKTAYLLPGMQKWGCSTLPFSEGRRRAYRSRSRSEQQKNRENPYSRNVMVLLQRTWHCVISAWRQ